MTKKHLWLIGSLVTTLFLTDTATAFNLDIEDQDYTDFNYKKVNQNSSDLDGHQEKLLFQWAINQNIINGYPDGNYMPDKPISEGEFLKVFLRAFGYHVSNQGVFNESNHHWTDSSYRMAKVLNIPTLGSTDFNSRLIPITRRKAAEIITSSQGVNLEGDDAIKYVIVHGLTGVTARTIEEFEADQIITRSEAVKWVRQLMLKGMMEIKQRPVAITNLALPELSNSSEWPEVIYEDFNAVKLTLEDFNLYDMTNNNVISLGTSRDQIEDMYGESNEMNIFNYNNYPYFSAEFDSENSLMGWEINTIDNKHANYKTYKGIVLNKSTLFEVLELYGTAGYAADGIANYYYEKANETEYKPIFNTISRESIKNPDNTYMLSFIFNKKTLIVEYINVSTFQTVLNFNQELDQRN
ncbi:S-layer homology domain-containing protein [Paenibacillus lautus]|uniref:S-layer homology domain-containing protein n=1 Tax=Paenibacillus lautus TaxID=1401 RepID=UPI002DC0366B|nr:S-layer homology domain-containing protein [Paenibacillus lautus]MEC0206866.1 S-layer homology domain-containing protein [Paenibacillus lautus]